MIHLNGGRGIQITFRANLEFWWVSLFLYTIVLCAVELLSAFLGLDHSLESASSSMGCLQVEINSITLISLSGSPVFKIKT